MYTAAAAGSCRVWAAVAAVLALVAVVGASSLSVFQGPGCTGSVSVLTCGSCKPINLRGGYYFLDTGGIAQLYSSNNCSDSNPAKVLNDDEFHCQSFNYKSVLIACSVATAATSSSGDVTVQRQQ